MGKEKRKTLTLLKWDLDDRYNSHVMIIQFLYFINGTFVIYCGKWPRKMLAIIYWTFWVFWSWTGWLVVKRKQIMEITSSIFHVFDKSFHYQRDQLNTEA